MTPAERLAKLLAAQPKPTVEIVVAWERFMVKPRVADVMISMTGPLLEVMFGSVELVEEAPAEAAILNPLTGERSAC